MKGQILPIMFALVMAGGCFARGVDQMVVSNALSDPVPVVIQITSSAGDVVLDLTKTLAPGESERVEIGRLQGVHNVSVEAGTMSASALLQFEWNADTLQVDVGRETEDPILIRVSHGD